MGEFHPAEKKVVVEFSPQDFGLTREQQTKLIKLVGPRYNPEKKVIKMSCESFEHQAQNKRHLAETVEKLVAEAKVRIWRSTFFLIAVRYEQSTDSECRMAKIHSKTSRLIRDTTQSRRSRNSPNLGAYQANVQKRSRTIGRRSNSLKRPRRLRVLLLTARK